MEKNDLFDHLDRNTNVLKNQGVRGAFEAIDRADFIGEDYRIEAYEDYAVPAGYGQIVAKPTLAAFMLELLDAHSGDKVLEVGSGTGWVTALLSHIVGNGGSVLALEAIPELAMLAKENIAKYDFPQTSIDHAGSELGSVQRGPYDRILVMADAGKVPYELVGQLRDGGTIVLPIEGSITRIIKRGGKTSKESFPGQFAFSQLQ